SFIDGDTPPWVKDMGYMGTDGYRSPEHIRRQRPTFASDVFTCGIILYEILCNDSPFPVDNYDKLVLSYKPSEPVLLSNYPDESNDIICQTLKRCLNPDPKKRPTAAEVHAILLGHKTIKGTSGDGKPGGGAIRPGEKPKVTKTPVVLTPVTPSEPVVSEAPRKTPIQLVGSISKINASINTKIGKPTLRNLCGEEGSYAETVQYTLECEGDSWYIVPNPDATNDTMLNGKRIVEKTLLKRGDQIGVGRESKGVVKALVTVQF
ncbi:MAG: protein kinase, partial [Thermoguttaceae bacterium]|nr:protein kinase [Thermoguttaceae bacterium]